MSTDAFEKFRKSMKIGYMEWREGIGYDLQALDALTPDELLEAEKLWRDVEALDHIGSARASSEVRSALTSKTFETRIEAARHLARRKLLDAHEVESVIVQALEEATISNGLVKTLNFAAANSTEAVRDKLRWCAVDGNDDIRVHAAALFDFLHGGSSSDFDCRFRPLYLKFKSNDRHARSAAYVELCAKLGLEPGEPALNA